MLFVPLFSDSQNKKCASVVSWRLSDFVLVVDALSRASLCMGWRRPIVRSRQLNELTGEFRNQRFLGCDFTWRVPTLKFWWLYFSRPACLTVSDSGGQHRCCYCNSCSLTKVQNVRKSWCRPFSRFCLRWSHVWGSGWTTGSNRSWSIHLAILTLLLRWLLTRSYTVCLCLLVSLIENVPITGPDGRRSFLLFRTLKYFVGVVETDPAEWHRVHWGRFV